MSRTLIKILALLLFITSVCNGNTACTVSHYQDVNVTENDLPGRLILDLDDPQILTLSTFQHEAVLLEYFAESIRGGRIETIKTIDRDDIASRIGRSFDHTVVTFEYISFRAINNFLCTYVTLHINDINDEAPQFETDSIIVPIREELFQSVPLGRRAADRDEGINSTCKYTLVDDLNGLFTLDVRRDTTGYITQVLLKNTVKLDRENVSEYFLQLKASEGTDDPQFDILDLNVTVTDICDNAPRFITSRYFPPPIPENSPIGSVIFNNITAYDADLVDKDGLTYGISEICRQKENDSVCQIIAIGDYPFMLNTESGLLTLEGELDREEYAQYEVSIHVTDQCEPARSATATVKVVVEDVNDNCPGIIYTPSGDSNQINEDVRNLPNTVGFFDIRDSDSGRNGMFSVSLSEEVDGQLYPSSTFSLNKNIRLMVEELNLVQRVDREFQNQYNLVVSATDFGHPSCTETFNLSILVTDSNDNPPMFQTIMPVYEIEEELQENYEVVTLLATDIDDIESGGGLVTYSLPESSEAFPHQHLFKVENVTGVLKLGTSLDREVYNSFSILVVANDNPNYDPILNDPTFNVSIIVNITLIDINDNPPIIHFPVGTFEVSEDHRPNTLLFSINATDSDTAPHSRLTYQIISNGPFSINENNGMVFLNENGLDFEDTQQYELTVRVTDSVYEREENIIVIVSNVNDERPRFVRQPPMYTGSVREESQVTGEEVAVLEVTDPDTSTENLQIQIEYGNELGHFVINPTTGVITTTTSLDKEDVANYTLTITVTDGDFFASENAIVFITVLDINDNPPVFVGLPYHFQVTEGYPENTVVRGATEDDVVRATDLDTEVNAAITYAILGTTPTEAIDWFLINPNTGEITTKIVLDREDSLLGANGIVMLSVEASNPMTGTSRTNTIEIVEITVEDVNDEAPFFDVSSITINLSESQGTGEPFLRVEATDRDQPPFNEIRYSILNFPPGILGQFNINQMTGDISLLTSLDYENQQRIDFQVQAQDAHLLVRQVTQSITINVIDAPEPCLKFVNLSPFVTLVENSALGTDVVSFEATNLQGQSVSTVVYTLTNIDGSESHEFDISENHNLQASVHTAVPNIDREALVSEGNTQAAYRLNITAHDTVSSLECVTIFSSLTITILDENDNPPEFSQQLYEFTIVENIPAGYTVGSVSTTDADLGENSQVQYSIMQTDNTIPFSIDSNSGAITSTEQLDHDQPSRSSYEFTVIGQDRGLEPQVSNTIVQVDVLDANDNSPEFNREQNHTIGIEEDASVDSIVAVILVDDADSGAFGEVTVSINPGSRLDQHFELLQDGSIRLVRELDREREDRYTFVVQAQDGGERSATAMFTIVVEDVNDNAPVFNLQPIGTVSIPENFPLGTNFTNVSATDKDSGLNAKVYYVLEDESLAKIFCIHHTTGFISLCTSGSSTCVRPSDNRPLPPIDYERNNSYVLTILAYDDAFPRHFVSRTLHIAITNVNEYAPEFDRSTVVVSVDEAQEVGTEVIRIQAYDWDYDRLTYSLLEGSENSVNFRYQDGAIVTSTVLDYNVRSLYLLSLRAQELNTEERQFGSILVEIFVNNRNNHQPVFNTIDYSTSTEISESTPIGSLVLTVYATDPDNATNDAVSYRIVGGNEGNSFSIDSHTGIISVNSSLDYDSISSYVLTVKANDTGYPQLISTALELSITIQNVNDELPIFTNTSYEFQLTENSQPNTIVGQVEAPDRDLQPFGNVKYSLGNNPQPNNLFDVDENSGNILSLVNVDREGELASMFPVTFTVVASDSGQSASTVVTVHLVDANDNPPIFSRRLYYQYIVQTQVEAVSILNLGPEVTDLDYGINAEVQFEIRTQLQEDILEISSSGNVMLKQALPATPDIKLYEITVRATDQLDPTMYDDAIVRIVVEADNEHHPRFDQLDGYMVDVPEDTDMSSTIIDMNEHVSDSDSNSLLSFQFQQNYPDFVIDSASGVITLRNSLNYDQGVKMYDLIVQVTDNTQRTSEAIVTVNVIGVNDNLPVFDNIPSTYVLSQVPDADIDLFTVRATDDDEGSDGIVEYLVSENGETSVYFDIDSETGTLKSKGALTVGQAFHLTVTAYDAGDPLASTEATIDITIHSPPANRVPTFQGVSNTPLILQVNEDRENGLLYQFTTFPSADGYTIVSSDAPSGLFLISSSQGRLTLQGELNFSERSNYELVIEAYIQNTQDLSNIVRYSSYLNIQIEVVDVNDHYPQFLTSNQASISENAPPGTFVSNVNAFDEDSGINAMLNYEIIGGNINRAFSINATSGDVTLRESIDREMYSSYDLQIHAFDLSSNPKFQEMILHINVIDVNDYSPRFVKDGNYSIGVYEYPHTDSGDDIVRLGAIDLDEGTRLRYDIFLTEARYRGGLITQPPPSTFGITLFTGIISTNVQLDYESIDYYLLRIEVSDSITTVSTYLEVNILDVNDHSPEIILSNDDPTHVIEVWEKQPVGSIVTDIISSSDDDLGINGLVKFSLGDEWKQAGDTFIIDPYTGVIRVKNPIVFRQSTFSFHPTVHASDQGNPPRSVSKVLNVRISDINDHSPVFEQQSYVFNVSIDSPENKLIGTVAAHDDLDYQENAAVFLMVPHYYSEANHFFSFDDSGTFRFLPMQGIEAKNYSFRVQAYSPSFCPGCPSYNNVAYTDVTVIVFPSCPHFEVMTHNIDVVEGPATQEVILELSATSSVGRQVEYFLNRSVESFTLGRYSGQLTLSGDLDRENVSLHEFSVIATDSEFQPLTCSTMVRINVEDVNDNRPVFQNKSYFSSVMENLPPPVPVTNVTATDRDLGPNATVVYELAGSLTLPFNIDEQTGVITTKETFDAENIVLYKFQVRAVDNGPQRLESFVNVTVTIEDMNEFKPTVVALDSIEIEPNRFTTGDIVGTVQANDNDEASQLMFSFINEDPKTYFRINNRTGDIVLIARQTGVSTTDGFIEVKGIVFVTDGDFNVTTEVQFYVHKAFMPITEEPFDFNIIIIVVVALVVAVIAAFLLLLVIALVCRHRRISRKVQIKDSAASNNMELGTRFSSRRSQGSRSSTPSQYRQTNTNQPYVGEHKKATLHHSSGSGSNSSRQSYANYADDEMDSTSGDPNARTAYHSPGLPKKQSSHQSPRTRSASDLTSNSTGSQQLPHPKARIAAIYAAHHDLLNNHGSQESIHSNHTFASEGGGEADAEADIENMLYSKYNFEDDEDDVTTIPDDSSYGGKEPHSLNVSGNLNVPPVEEDHYPYGQSSNSWVPRANPIDHAIEELSELASYPSTVSQEDPHMVPRSGHYTNQYEHSQPVSMQYGPASSQGSRISLLRHYNGGHSQPRPYDMPSQMAQPLPHEFDYYHSPSQEPRYIPHPDKQRYGSANALSIHSREYNSVPPRDLRGEPRYHSPRARIHHHGLSQDVPPTYHQSHDVPQGYLHSQDVPPTYHQSHDVPQGYLHSQEVPPTYHQSHYLQRGVNTHTPSSDTPSDGTVTPHRAMAEDYSHEPYLSSESSTSIGSTNLSGTTSSIGHSASQRM